MDPTMDDLPQRLQAVLRRQRRQLQMRDGFRPAAVLVPFVRYPEGWHLLLVRRSPALPAHGGQVAFPGGAVEPQDGDAIATALREAEEEIGLAAEDVHVWGIFDDFGPTSSRFIVTPVLAQIPAEYPFRINPYEIESYRTVPFAFFLETEHLIVEHRDTPGLPATTYTWHYESYTIWGLTARIIKALLDAIYTTPASPPSPGITFFR
ncbi:MAG: CoA pyrophosphatase [Caldilineae bacterium]|nr:MAG: CoA pyrophosphatase [Caldilineae bacterium]